jgi:hypothetical protein
MSGGHWDGRQFAMTMIADDLDHVVETNDNDTLDEWGNRQGKGYSKRTLDRIKKTALALRALERAVHHIDYLLSGDHGEDTFDKAWRRDVESKGGLDGEG